MQETTSDAIWFSRNSANSSNAQPVAKMKPEAERWQHIPKVDKSGHLYDMSGFKYLYIFNHQKFEKIKHFKNTCPSERIGTVKDVENLNTTFGAFGFQVEIFNDLYYKKIMSVVTELSKQDHSNTSCIGIAILTHGGKGKVFAADRPYKLEDITKLLQVDGLDGKPKVLFVNACRSGHTNGGRDHSDANEVLDLDDCLIMYSSYEDYLTYLTKSGSLMIRSLCQVLNEYDEIDAPRLMTLVNYNVSKMSSYSKKNPSIHNKKQIPNPQFNMNKYLVFKKKNS